MKYIHTFRRYLKGISKKIITSVLFATLGMGAQAQINAYFSSCAFNTPDNKPYLETYLSIFGNSASFKKNAAGKYQGQVEVGVLFSQNGQIKASKKYMLLSPELSDTLKRTNFIDLQRFALDTGAYDFEQMITDKNNNGKTLSVKRKIRIDFPAGKVNISDIELVSSFTKAPVQTALTKNGYDIVPYMADFFYPEEVTEISFYAEVYNTKKLLGENEKFLVSYYIEGFETKKLLSKFTAFKRETTSDVNPILTKFNIADLPSGNYNLVTDCKNKNNEVVASKKVFFQRKNAKAKIDLGDLAGIAIENTFASRIKTKDSLTDAIRCIRPIASEAEKSFLDNQLKLADETLMQQFFYNFWHSRSSLAPEEAWNSYAKDVKSVNAKFGTFNYKGYETDRGRVYLQYGPPDKREVAPSEPNAYPYEIWVYYTLEDKSKLNPPQTNRQFIFWNKDLVTNNFQILHSDALSEPHESRWEIKLHGRMVQSHDFEKKDAPEHYGGNSHNEFGNPK